MIIKCKARFRAEGNQELEVLGIETEEKFEYDDFAFKLSEVIAINKSTKGTATVWFQYTSVGTNIEYNSLVKIWFDHEEGRRITYWTLKSTLEFIETDKLLEG